MNIKVDAMRRAQTRVGTRQAAVTWGLIFAQADLNALLDSEQEVWQLELHAFAHQSPRGISSDGECLTELYNLDFAEAQQILLDIFRAAAAREPLETPLRGQAKAVWWENRYIHFEDTNEYQLSPADWLRVGTIRLIERLPQGYVVNACQAPQFQQHTLCGRLFLTNKSRQRYCSPTCQQRAHHRRNHYSRPRPARVS
jgi:hypothetical protein